MNDEFIKLLELEYEELKLGLANASVEGKGTPQEIADRREELFHSFFEKYFPFPYRITKGNIDSKNKKASVIFADGVDYAIEIKGNLTDKDEIERALKQIESVKKLTRVRNGLIWDKDKNEYTYKIPTIIFAENTYSNIENLIEVILNYYKENKIKRIHQFDIIVAGDYTIVNSCKGQISFNDVRGIFFEKTDKKTLAVLLFLMANMPLVHPTYNENIYNIYLDKIFTNASYRDDWNKCLEDIENS